MAQTANTNRVSPMQQLVEHKLGTSIVEWVDAKREASHVSWRRLASELGNEMGEYVTHEALRKWYIRAKRAGEAVVS